MTESEIWKVVGLYTKDGEFVAQTRIPSSFAGIADVILWGQRAFVWKGGCYQEAFVVAISPEQVEKDVEVSMNMKEGKV